MRYALCRVAENVGWRDRTDICVSRVPLFVETRDRASSSSSTFEERDYFVARVDFFRSARRRKILRENGPVEKE